MKSLLLCLVAGVALADEIPPNACLGTQVAGDECSMDDGTPGQCIAERHEYVKDDGTKASWTELLCAPLVSSAQRSALPWLGFGLAFLAACAALYSRRREERSPVRGVAQLDRGAR